MTSRGFFICGCLVSILLFGPHRLVDAPPWHAPIKNQGPQKAPAGNGQATIVDKTPAELLQALPELAGLEPATSQEILPEILKKVGESVEAYFHNVVSTRALEETIQERLGLNGTVEETFKQTFRYLVIPHPEKGPLDLEEYRTDEESHPASGTLRSGTVLTARFVYVPVYLHPVYQDDSDFSYLGQQTVEGRKCYVVAFAQVPETAHLRAWLTVGTLSYQVFLQGLVWIDQTSFRIIRMYMELLPDATARKIKEHTTEVTFGEVRFKGIDVVSWLPREVEVHIDWEGRKYRNYHRYSDYQLYASQTKIIY